MSGSVPEHWQTFTGPSGWYTVAFPPEWDARESDGILSLTAPGDGGVLSLRCSWLADPKRSSLERLLNLGRLFPKRRRVHPLRSLETSDESLGYGGEMPLPSLGPWWKRLFSPQAWRRWRVWALRQGHICLCALFLHREQPDPEAENLAVMILQTLQFPDKPADPPDVFTEKVLELAREKFPQLSCEPGPDFQLKIGESSINLLNFYRSYVAAPDQFESIMVPALSTVVQVQNWSQEQFNPKLSAVRDRIMPMLYPTEQWRERFPGFAGHDWVGGLAVLYVVDESHAYWYLRDELIEQWQLDAEDLHEIALSNLERYFDKAPMELTVVGEEDGPQLVLPNRPDAYNSSRWLSPKFRESVQEILGLQYAIGLPNRDFFVGLNLVWPAAIEQVQQRVRDDFQRMDHPLSQNLLLVTSDGVSEYHPEE